jgi:hypothetical protein
MAFVQSALDCMAHSRIHYTSQPGENRVRLYNGSMARCVEGLQQLLHLQHNAYLGHAYLGGVVL